MMKKNENETGWRIVWVNENTEQQSESSTGTFNCRDMAKFFCELLKRDKPNCTYDIKQVKR